MPFVPFFVSYISVVKSFLNPLKFRCSPALRPKWFPTSYRLTQCFPAEELRTTSSTLLSPVGWLAIYVISTIVILAYNRESIKL